MNTKRQDKTQEERQENTTINKRHDTKQKIKYQNQNK